MTLMEKMSEKRKHGSWFLKQEIEGEREVKREWEKEGSLTLFFLSF